MRQLFLYWIRTSRCRVRQFVLYWVWIWDVLWKVGPSSSKVTRCWMRQLVLYWVWTWDVRYSCSFIEFGLEILGKTVDPLFRMFNETVFIYLVSIWDIRWNSWTWTRDVVRDNLPFIEYLCEILGQTIDPLLSRTRDNGWDSLSFIEYGLEMLGKAVVPILSKDNRCWWNNYRFPWGSGLE
jgi:hypothetical protein